ncbi:MAG: hypothetical protein QG581_338 [Patescibacteria group bacterium]|jgi:hypothetical protein|nr:hypothetical protein [Patescibacteria group bacterium]
MDYNEELRDEEIELGSFLQRTHRSKSGTTVIKNS